MKRALGLILITVACIVGFLSIRGTMPFIPIFGSSMEPTLQSGNLLTIEPMDARDVEMGDIIVYNVPKMVREYYGYPPIVAHRVIEIKTMPSLGFRTAGDNTGEDPFTVRPQDLRGTVGNQIPLLGLPLLFLQSQQGIIFVIIALGLLAFYLYGGELTQGSRILHRGIFAPVINEEKRANRALSHQIASTEQRMNSTEQALEKFAAAIELYAQHLNSHTGAIQGLSGASQELRISSAEQNRVLMHLMETMGQPRPKEAELASRVEPTVSEPERPALATERPALAAEIPMLVAERPMLEPEKPVAVEAVTKQYPPGCARNRPKPTAEEITERLRKLEYQV
jgi:signal peptidase I